jgi:hypothetical protein
MLDTLLSRSRVELNLLPRDLADLSRREFDVMEEDLGSESVRKEAVPDSPDDTAEEGRPFAWLTVNLDVAEFG